MNNERTLCCHFFSRHLNVSVHSSVHLVHLFHQFYSVLVLSGVTSEEKLLSPENSITPDFYADTINDFFAESEAKVL